MDRKLGGVVLFLASGSAFAAAPFCVFSAGGADCNYFDYAYCQSVARSMQGACAPNNAPQQQMVVPSPAPAVRYNPPPQPQYQVLDSFKSISEAGEAGARMGMERREHDARMRLMQAQTQAATAPKVTYMCLDANDKPFLTFTPLLGCTVASVAP